MDLFTSALKWTQSGPQSISEKGRTVNIQYRGLHPSYIGRIGLISASSGDPGLSGTFSPFMKNNGYYFEEFDEMNM